jgi:thiol-disulfide isomerase/thioredoxin
VGLKDFIQEKPLGLVVVIGLMIVFLLSACATQAGPAQPAFQEPVPSVEGTASATPPEVDEIVGSTTATLSPVPADTASAAPSPEPAVQPTPRLDLHATDPSEVTLAAGKPQLVEFFAFWWPTCRSLAPVVHGLEAEYGSQVNFIYLDIDDRDTEPFKQELGYRYQPHLFLVDADGNILQQWVGRVSGDELERAILASLSP